MIPINISEETCLEIVSVNHKPYMFTNMRIDRKSLPDGFVAYDVRDDDDCSGTFAQIQPYVWVNHWGTIIGLDELPLDPVLSDFDPGDEEDWWFTGDYVETPKEFKNRYNELLDQCV